MQNSDSGRWQAGCFPRSIVDGGVGLLRHVVFLTVGERTTHCTNNQSALTGFNSIVRWCCYTHCPSNMFYRAGIYRFCDCSAVAHKPRPTCGGVDRPRRAIKHGGALPDLVLYNMATTWPVHQISQAYRCTVEVVSHPNRTVEFTSCVMRTLAATYCPFRTVAVTSGQIHTARKRPKMNRTDPYRKAQIWPFRPACLHVRSLTIPANFPSAV